MITHLRHGSGGKDSGKRLDLISLGTSSAAEVGALAAQLASAGVRLAHEPQARNIPDPGRAVGDDPGESADGFAITEEHLQATIEAQGESAAVTRGNIVLLAIRRPRAPGPGMAAPDVPGTSRSPACPADLPPSPGATPGAASREHLPATPHTWARRLTRPCPAS